MDKGLQERWHRNSQELPGYNLTSIGAKVYNVLLLNHIETELEKIPRKRKNGFRTNQNKSSQILTIRQM